MSCQRENCLNPSIPRGKYCEIHRTRKKICIESGCTSRVRDKSNKCFKHGGGKKCSEIGCDRSANTNDKCIRHGGGNRCTEIGCNKGAGRKGDKCKTHGGGNRCIEDGCNKTSQGKTDKCKEHGGGKLCSESDCKSNAYDKSGKCIKHGGGKRCSEIGCIRNARGLSDKCCKHGGGNRCTENGCNYSAPNGYNKCRTHGGGKRCNEKGCGKSTIGSTDKCRSHGGGKRCNEIGCKNSSANNSDKCKKHGGGNRCKENGCNYSAPNGYDKCVTHGGGKRCVYPNCDRGALEFDKCKAHGGGNRCPNCINWIDSRSGSSKYDSYCATCFKRVFPDDPRSKIIHIHTKEIQVRNAIAEKAIDNQYFQGFIHDKPLYTGNCDCTHRRRIDHRKLIGNTILAVETDEYAHRNYDEKQEEIRYNDLYMIHSGKWIYIRFNPDDIKSQKIDLEDRIIVLLEEIEKQIIRIENDKNTDLIEIIKLFY